MNESSRVNQSKSSHYSAKSAKKKKKERRHAMAAKRARERQKEKLLILQRNRTKCKFSLRQALNDSKTRLNKTFCRNVITTIEQAPVTDEDKSALMELFAKNSNLMFILKICMIFGSLLMEGFVTLQMTYLQGKAEVKLHNEYLDFLKMAIYSM